MNQKLAYLAAQVAAKSKSGGSLGVLAGDGVNVGDVQLLEK